MPSPVIDFRAIRSHHGSQNGGFEELVCQLAALETPAGVLFHRKGAGADAGVECYRIEDDGSETGWQAKYFFELGSGEAGQLKESFDNAVDKHPRLKRFIVCLPFDLSDGRVGRQKSERDRWNDWIVARQTSIAPREVSIELWGAFQLTERLSRSDPLHVGRRTYWFDTPHFGSDWLKARFAVTRAALGRRYSPELNVELPIRQALAGFARDPDFLRRLSNLADSLDEARHRALHDIGKVIGTNHAADYAALRDHVAAISTAMRTTPLRPLDQLPLVAWARLVAVAITALHRCSALIWDIRSQPNGDRDAARRGLYFVEHLQEALDRIDEMIGAPGTALSNARRLLLTGEAGVGKSHLLADVAEHHIDHGFPAVLMVGGAFSDADPWCQIAEQLGLTGTPPDAILGALDAAAEAVGTRALVMIDAINERNGVAVWSQRLAAFLAVADGFGHVAVLVSCRTTFVPYIVRDLDETALPRLAHPGFAGKAAEAARRYLDQRGIVRMAAPHFAPEFENPLFLRTCCDMLERRGERELPRGLAGVSNIFDFYFGAVVETLNYRMGLMPRLKRTETGLAALTEAMVAAGVGYLPVDRANEILEEIHPSAGLVEQSLFFQLESEGVLAVELVREGDATVEMVRFTFERLSDHRIAQRLLDTHVGTGQPGPAFVVGGPLAPYVIGGNAHRFAGIAEAFAVQLPERYGVELIETVQDKGARWDLVHGFRQSLLWRRQAVFTERTLELVEEWEDAIGGDAVLDTLLAIATEPDNRFNADHLDRWLRPLTMPDRDEQWSIRVTRLVEQGESPVETLIQWVLANGLEEIHPPRARLSAITLAWLTSLSHRWVRDMATKALATLLVDRRDLAAALIAGFASVDDTYVVDRVLAAAYGGATRRASNDGLGELARAAFNAVFARDPLPTHALIRDHARGIIELAAARGVLPTDVPLTTARPPYPRGAPLEIITKDDLGSYVRNYSGSLFADEICHSAVEDGDFARYQIDPVADHFLLLPREELGRSMREIYDAWYSIAIAAFPDRRIALDKVIELAERAHSRQDTFDLWDRRSDADDAFEARRAAERERDEAIGALEHMLSADEVLDFRMRAAGFLHGRMWDERASAWHPTYSGPRARNWVAWRAHELGWTSERFEEFDRHFSSHGRNEHRIERIGKKYQWVAYHELVGRLSDISLLDGRFRDEPKLYAGPWQVGAREMDPTILVTRTKQRDSDRQGATWWSPHASRWRNDPPEARIAWMEDQTRDMPDPVQQIDVTDPKGRRWLVLDTSVGRNHWVVVDGQRVIHRMTWHKVKSLLVARADAPRLERLLTTSAQDRDHPPEVELSGGGYLGEYPWHAAFADANGKWDIGSTRRITVEGTIADWYVERSGHDYSIEESFNLTIPAPAVVAGLNLRLAEGRSLAYANGNGTVLFKDPSAEEPGFSAAVVDREAMRAFLEREELDIIWIFTGEKSAHGGRPHGNGWGGMLEYWGIYRFEADSLRGELNFERKDPGPEQLEELLGNP